MAWCVQYILDMNAHTNQAPDYFPQFPGRTLQTGICVYWKDNGRVYVEGINGSTAAVRSDCGEGRRGKVRIVPITQLDSEREWKFL